MPHATMTQVGETDSLPFYRHDYWEPSSQGYTTGGRARNAGGKKMHSTQLSLELSPNCPSPQMNCACYFLSQTSQSLYSRASLAWGLFHSLRAILLSVQFSSVAQSCLTLCDPLDCSTPGFPVLHYLRELAQSQVHWISDDIQPFRSASFSCPQISQHQGLFYWVGSSHQIAKVFGATAWGLPTNIRGWFPLELTSLN